MRRLALTLAFAVLSLAFAPAPFPRAERQTRDTRQQLLTRECQRRLRELGVTCEVVTRDGAPCVRFDLGNGPCGGGQAVYYYRVRNGDVPGTLRMVLRYVERLRRNGASSPP